jgi:hypothetical protein
MKTPGESGKSYTKNLGGRDQPRTLSGSFGSIAEIVVLGVLPPLGFDASCSYFFFFLTLKKTSIVQP